jgi:hypothetical protein
MPCLINYLYFFIFLFFFIRNSFIFLMMREYILIQCFPSHLILCNISSRLILIDGHERPGLYQVFIEVILIFKINIKILYPRRG